MTENKRDPDLTYLHDLPVGLKIDVDSMVYVPLEVLRLNLVAALKRIEWLEEEVNKLKEQAHYHAPTDTIVVKP